MIIYENIYNNLELKILINFFKKKLKDDDIKNLRSVIERKQNITKNL